MKKTPFKIKKVRLPYRACLKMAFRKLRVPGGGRFCPNEGGLNPLRQPNEGKISHKVGLAACGNDFSDTRWTTASSQKL